MPRHPEPSYYASRGAWYVQVHGKKILLAKGAKAATRDEARAAYHRLMASGEIPGLRRKTALTVAALADLFLEHQTKNAELTYEWYRRHLQSFVDQWGRAKAEDIGPTHVEKWAGSHEWADATRHGAITAVKTMYSWGVKKKHLTENPLTGIERPGIRQREAVLSPEQAERIIGAVDREFRDLLIAMRETGARPSEVARIEACMINTEAGIIVMESKRSRRTRRPRVIVMTRCLRELLLPLAERHPKGPILRNTRGNPWTRNAMACRFADLRDRLGMGKEATAESFRHLFATDAAVKGVPIETTAALMGHEGTKMLERHYLHLHKRVEHLRDAAETVRPRPDDGDPVDERA
jgi:integrase